MTRLINSTRYEICRSAPLVVAAGFLFVVLGPLSTTAEESWNPFPETREAHKPKPPRTTARNRDVRREFRPGAPYTRPGDRSERIPGRQNRQGSQQQPYQPEFRQPAPGTSGRQPFSPSVERGELAPVMSSQSGLPFGLWQGLSVSDVEQLVAPLQLPAQSMVLQQLWQQILTAPDAPSRSNDLTAVRVEALYRSGRLLQASTLLRKEITGRSSNITLSLLQARTELALNNRADGCRAAKLAGGNKSKLPKPLRGEAIILAGYCAVAAGNKAAAGLAAELARDEGYSRRFTLAILDSIANGRRRRSTLPKVVRATDYLLLRQAGFDQPARLVPKASPALLAVLIDDREIASEIRIAAAEQAAKDNVIAGGKLADIYRQYRPPVTQDRALGAETARAVLFQDAERTPTPLRRTRAIRKLVDDAKRANLAVPTMVAVKPMVDQLHPAPEISWFALTAIEIMLASGDYDGMLPWLALSQAADRVYSEALQHWRILADIANPAAAGKQIDLSPLERLTARGRLSGPSLRRLTTILDALDYNVPVSVWDAANRTPKVKTGKLPPTGVLTQLLAASKAKESARTVLLAMRALNGSSAPKAHPIALSDSIRALNRAGLVKEARRLAFEAMFASWPRPGEY